MPQPLKPSPLHPGDAIRVLSLASPVKDGLLQKGCDELNRLGYVPKVDREAVLAANSFFAGPATNRRQALQEAFAESDSKAIFCSRGGYGSNYLLDSWSSPPARPKILLGSSDITSLQIFLWQKYRCVTFYGPMVASNFCHGAGAPHGYDGSSFTHALTETSRGWTIALPGESLIPSSAEGTVLGGCLTLLETSLGTPWELDTHGAILILEDRGMKPYQVDRALMHLKLANKFNGVLGIILGEFPECDPPEGGESVRDVARRILGPLGVPLAWSAPIGHTGRAALTIPLGIRARLFAPAAGEPRLEILEPACAA